MILLPSVSCLILEDLKTGIQTDLRSTTSYSFSISDTTAHPRFLLRIGKPIETFSAPTTCNGNQNGMAAVAGNGTGPWNYIWENQYGTIVQSHYGSTGPDTLSQLAAGTYTVHISGNTGPCNNIDAVITIGALDTINVNTETVNASCPDSQDGSLQVVDVVGGTSPYTFNWSDNSTGSQVVNLTPGNYTLTITDSTGCEEQFQYTLVSNSNLSAEYFVSNDTVYLNNDEAIEFTAPDKAITSFVWNFGDGSLPNNSTNPSYLYLLPGVYQTTLVASDGTCVDSASQVIVVEPDPFSVGIDQIGTSESIEMNIHDQIADITFQLNTNSSVKVEVYNAAGQKMFTDRKVTGSSGKISYDMNDLSSGVYYFRIYPGSKKAVTKKMVKL